MANSYIEMTSVLSEDNIMPFFRQHGFVVPQEELAAKRKSTEYIAFVFVEERYLRNAVQVYKAAGGYYLCGYHMGTIAKRDAVLSQMMQHIEAEGHEVIGPALIVNLADENDSSDESDFLYQIQIPIVRNL